MLYTSERTVAACPAITSGAMYIGVPASAALGHEVRMANARERSLFLDRLRLVVQQLQRHLAVEALVPRAEHLAERSAAERLEDPQPPPARRMLRRRFGRIGGAGGAVQHRDVVQNAKIFDRGSEAGVPGRRLLGGPVDRASFEDERGERFEAIAIRLVTHDSRFMLAHAAAGLGPGPPGALGPAS